MPNSGLDSMIDLDKINHLSRLYRLFTMVTPGLPCLRKALKESIARRGKDINMESLGITEVDDEGKGKGKLKSAAQILAHALKWVQDVLDLKDKFDSVWKRAFDSNRELESALNEVCQVPSTAMALKCLQAFGSFINANDKCAEYISLFIDDNLKKGLKGVRACPSNPDFN